MCLEAQDASFLVCVCVCLYAYMLGGRAKAVAL